MKNYCNHLFYRAFLGFVSVLASVCAAQAETATFVTPVNGDPATVAGVSDGAGVVVAPGATVGLLFSEAFALLESGSPVNNDVSIFALSDFGSALATINFGRYNNGSPTIVFSQQINPQPSGAEFNLNFLAFVGCGSVGGCDYIEFVGNPAFGGASVIIDAVAFSDVTLSSVTAATPEPGMWVLMVLGFFLVSARLKYVRYGKKRVSAQSAHATLQTSSPAASAYVPEHSLSGATIIDANGTGRLAA